MTVMQQIAIHASNWRYTRSKSLFQGYDPSCCQYGRRFSVDLISNVSNESLQNRNVCFIGSGEKELTWRH